jgi:hypothetical protein
MFGQFGLAAMKACKRAKSALLSPLRRIAHSTSLRAVGSAIRCCASLRFRPAAAGEADRFADRRKIGGGDGRRRRVLYQEIRQR